ncbi:hypothetical protein [Labrys sp. ZIDIC5]|uniref:hypothetical protein n=1 Tax=Labrys sedimenti TaxID=3106036 RepID=UPI002AC9FC54|nr:hypothetical protein [Labrys sp. ZIDIC5]MDZ5448937.1 hypothetical protein [Labrys sp. ZIDIC5]
MSKLLTISVVIAATGLVACTHTAKRGDSAAAPAYAEYQRCTRAAAWSMARTNQSVDAVVSKAMASCKREEEALHSTLMAVGATKTLDELKADQAQSLKASVTVLRGDRL